MSFKRYLFFSLFSIAGAAAFGQFDRAVTLRATANFNVVSGGLATNEIGMGLGMDASFFSKSRLQALVETSGERFIGDKLLVVDNTTGKKAKGAAILGIRGGPQYFLTRNIAVAATCGPALHVLREFHYSLDYGFKYSVTAFGGSQRRMVGKLFLVTIPVESGRKIRYFGIAGGVRLL